MLVVFNQVSKSGRPERIAVNPLQVITVFQSASDKCVIEMVPTAYITRTVEVQGTFEEVVRQLQRASANVRVHGSVLT